MEQNWSKEPWRLEVTPGPVPVTRIISGEGPFLECAVVEDECDPRDEANYKRIVACVNACAGIPTEALQRGVIQKLIETATTPEPRFIKTQVE
jgi:hypothetical protein